MLPPEKFIFVNSLGSGHTKRAHELQRSTIRSHAAATAHERAKERRGLAVDREKGQRNVTEHEKKPADTRSRLPTPPLSPDDEECEVYFESSYGQIAEPLCHDTNTLYSPPESPQHFADDIPLESDEAREDSGLNSNTGALVPNKTPSYTFHETKGGAPITIQWDRTAKTSPFNISLDLEGFRGLRTDPFFCIPATSDMRVATTIDYYCQDLTPRYDLVCDVFDVTNIYAFFLEVIQNEYFYHAGMAALQALAEQQRVPGSRPSAHVFNHRGSAIAKLRKKLTSIGATADDITLFAMTFLATLEGQLGNFHAHTLHKKTVATIIKQRGGLKALPDGSVLKGTLMQYDTFWAMQTGSTIFPGERRPYVPDYPHPPFDPELSLRFSVLPSGFETLANNCLLSYDTLDVLTRATDRARMNIHSLRREEAARRKSRRKYNDFWEACPSFSISDEQCSVLEKLMCFTLVIYCSIGFEESRSYNNIVRGARAQLTQKLPSLAFLSSKDSNPACYAAEARCHLWMWIVTIDSWRVGTSYNSSRKPILAPEGSALFCKLLQKHPQMRNMSEVEHVVQEFLWTTELRTSVKIYWEKFANDYAPE